MLTEIQRRYMEATAAMETRPRRPTLKMLLLSTTKDAPMPYPHQPGSPHERERNEIERLRVALHKSEAGLLLAQFEVERLTNGVKKIQEYLEEDRTGDALFVCDALLAR